MSERPLLEVEGLNAWYGESHVLHGMGFHVQRGELVTLLGRNGAGKSTTLKCVMGMLSARKGSVRFEGEEFIARPPELIARMGVALCPEERGIFSGLSVKENLLLPPVVKAGGMTVDEVLALFPSLKERLAHQGTKLSGGEQQMLALARILRTGARFLMLDEPNEGLAPVIVEQLLGLLKTLKARGYTLLLVEQSLAFASAVADRHYLVEHGQVIDMVPNAELASKRERVQRCLGV